MIISVSPMGVRALLDKPNLPRLKSIHFCYENLGSLDSTLSHYSLFVHSLFVGLSSTTLESVMFTTLELDMDHAIQQLCNQDAFPRMRTLAFCDCPGVNDFLLWHHQEELCRLEGFFIKDCTNVTQVVIQVHGFLFI